MTYDGKRHKHDCEQGVSSSGRSVYDMPRGEWGLDIWFEDDQDPDTKVALWLGGVSFCPFCGADLEAERVKAEAEAKRKADLRDDGHAKFIPIKRGEAGSDA